MDLKTTYKNGDLLPAEDINAITTAINALQDDFSDTDEQLSTLNEKVSENEENIANLGNKLESDYAKKSELDGYATNEQLQSVSQQLQNKADRSELTNLATKDELANKADKSELGEYAKKEQLSNYATKKDLAKISFDTISDEDIDNLYEEPDDDDRFRIIATKGKSIVKYYCDVNNVQYSEYGNSFPVLEYSKDGETYTYINVVPQMFMNYVKSEIELEEGEVLYLRRLPEYINSSTNDISRENNDCRIIIEGETEESEVKFKGNLMYMYNYNDITEIPTLTGIFQNLFTERIVTGWDIELRITNHWAKIDASGCEIPNNGWAVQGANVDFLFNKNKGLIKSPKFTDEGDVPTVGYTFNYVFYQCSNLIEITFLDRHQKIAAGALIVSGVAPSGILYKSPNGYVWDMFLPSGWEFKDYPPTKILDYDGLKYYNDKVMGYIAGGGEVDMSNYYTKSEVDGKLGGLATKTEISDLATKSELDGYAKKSDITDFVTKTEADKFATKDEISEFITEDSLEPYAKRSELSDLVA